MDFHIRRPTNRSIWEENGGEIVISDNNGDQAIGGGSIVVHAKQGDAGGMTVWSFGRRRPAKRESGIDRSTRVIDKPESGRTCRRILVGHDVV